MSTLTWGSGNIDADPLFADPGNGDYRLKSMGGRWDPAANGGAGGWVTDSVHSPCIDAGDPASDYAQETEPNGGCINAGAYGNTEEASRSFVPPTYTLTVLSAPVLGIHIAGDRPGTTLYAVTCDDQEVVNLAAPEGVSLEGRSCHFAFWAVDNVRQPSRQTDVQLIMDTNHTAMAVYDWRLPGDVTGDCLVNVLDMIFVRNHARTACSE